MQPLKLVFLIGMIGTMDTYQIAELLLKKMEKLMGWSALSPISSRCVYGVVAEVSVYVSKEHTGQNSGTKLRKQFILESENIGIWTLQ